MNIPLPIDAARHPESAVAVPFEIAYQGVEPSPVAERHVLRGIGRLESIAPELISARVTVAMHDRRHETGNLYDVSILLGLPGPDLTISRTPPKHTHAEDLVTAIGEAFDKARRKLIEVHQVARGDVKSHEEAPHGTVTDLFPDYGFIRGADKRVVYFHKNSVFRDEWDQLHVGAEVRFRDEPGDEGPQATTVTLVRPKEASTR